MSLVKQLIDNGQSAFGTIPPLVERSAHTLPPLADKYRAREGVSPLSHAFDGKIAIHPGLNGGRVEQDAMLPLLDDLLDGDRIGKTVAYIHVPFCQTRCSFCGFYNRPYRADESRTYTDTLIAEMNLWCGRRAVDSGPVHALYMGGGTPTALEPEDLERILRTARDVLPLANDCEITVEGRLSNMDARKIEACLAGGANRFSLGVQSFNTDVRRALGRIGSREDMLGQIDLLMRYEQAAVVVDLIYGLPGQTMEVWLDDLAVARSLNLDGLDCYQLNVFKQTPLGKKVEDGRITEAADVPMRSAMFATSVAEMESAFYRRLSLSPWSRTTRERNLYNLYVKGAAQCLAFGPGSGGNIRGHFYISTSDYTAWQNEITAGRKALAMMQYPHVHHRLFRTIAEYLEQGWMDLRDLEAQFSLPLWTLWHPLLEQWERAGLLSQNRERVVLTLAGQFWQVNLSQLLLDYLKNALEVKNHVAA